MRYDLALSLLVALTAASIACGGDAGSDDTVVEVGGTAQTSAATDDAVRPLTPDEICAGLTADEISGVLGRALTAEADGFDGCHYVEDGIVARLTPTTFTVGEARLNLHSPAGVTRDQCISLIEATRG